MTQEVALHHLAFDCPTARLHAGATDYGLRNLRVDGATGAELADNAFRDTNHPDMVPDVISADGFCNSLSTGDVVETPTGHHGRPEFHVTDHVGFFELSSIEFYQLRRIHYRHYAAGLRFNFADDGIAIAKQWRESKTGPLFDAPTWLNNSRTLATA